MLEVKVAAGIEPKIKGQVLEQLQQKLSQPQRLEPHVGFKSYQDIHSWLTQLFGLEIGYSTVHRIVRYQLKAKLKVPRPRLRSAHCEAIAKNNKAAASNI